MWQWARDLDRDNLLWREFCRPIEVETGSKEAATYSRFEYVAGILFTAVKVANCPRRLVKNPSGPTNKASGRSRARAAKAASISPIVVAFRIWIFNPSAGAASCTSRNVDSVFEALAGLTSTAIRTACSFGRERNRRDAGRHLRRNGSKRAHKSPACL